MATSSNTNTSTAPAQPGQAMNITNPWGSLGCIWRFIVFLLGILLMAFVFTQIKSCKDNSAIEDTDPAEAIVDSLISYLPDSVPWVPELPDSAHNVIPPIDSLAVVPNPEDSLFYMVDNQLFVFFNSKDLKKVQDDMTNFAKQFKAVYPDSACQIIHYSPECATMLLEVPSDSVILVRDELPNKIPGINFMAFTNDVWGNSGKPSDPGFSHPDYDEYFRLIQAYEAWDVTQGDSSVIVAIIDSYFDLTNPEIGERYILPINIPKGNNQVQPPSQTIKDFEMAANFAHGSHVAGIAIGGQNNKLGCSGIAPKCKWMPISVGDASTTVSIVEGIMFAVYHGASVVNISMGAQFSPFAQFLPISQQVAEAKKRKKQDKLWDYILKTAEDHHCTIVTAGGNDNILMAMDAMDRHDLIVKVENVDAKGKKNESSSFGIVPSHNVDYQSVAAPGTFIWSSSYKPALPFFAAINYPVSSKDGFQVMSGTSMSSPFVAGAIALMKSKNKNLSTPDIIKILRKTGRQTDNSGRIGPTIQIRDALDWVGGKPMNFGDVMKDHRQIIGMWKSTETISLTNNVTGKVTDEIWSYFTFSSTDKGRIDDRSINSSVVYTADLSVNWKQNSIEIVQADREKSNTNPPEYLGLYTYVCKPDKNGLLQVTTYENGKEKLHFYLEKVN